MNLDQDLGAPRSAVESSAVRSAPSTRERDDGSSAVRSAPPTSVPTDDRPGKRVKLPGGTTDGGDRVLGSTISTTTNVPTSNAGDAAMTDSRKRAASQEADDDRDDPTRLTDSRKRAEADNYRDAPTRLTDSRKRAASWEADDDRDALLLDNFREAGFQMCANLADTAGTNPVCEEPEEWDQEAMGDAYYDDMSGKRLDPAMIAVARQTEIDFIDKMGVWEIIPRKDAGVPVIKERWVDVNKGDCLLYTSPSPRDQRGSRMPSSA